MRSPFQAVIFFVSNWGGGLFFLSSNRISRARAGCSLSTASSTSANRAASGKLPLTIRTFLPRSSLWGSWEIKTQSFNKQRRQWESPKSKKFEKKNNNSTQCISHDILWYISLPSLHDYHLKFPNFTFYFESKRVYDHEFFPLLSILNLGAVLENSTPVKTTYIWHKRDEVRSAKTRIPFNSDLLLLSPSSF